MYSENNVSLEAKLYPSDVLLCKYRILFNRTEYGFMAGISILGLINFVNLFVGKDIGSIDIMHEIQSHFPGSVITLVFPIFAIVLLVRTYIDNRNEFKEQEYIHANYFFSSFGITMSAKTETNYMWKDIHEVKETNKHFLVYTSASSMLVVPKKDFIDVADIGKLRSLFLDKIPRKKLSLKAGRGVK